MKMRDITPEHKEFLKKIGERLRELRNTKGISYERMAEEIGISRNTYNMLEHGKIFFQFSTLLLVLKYHKIPLSEFFKELESDSHWDQV
jgi:transcriptional regulator with XRE-family HTH domain